MELHEMLFSGKFCQASVGAGGYVGLLIYQ